MPEHETCKGRRWKKIAFQLLRDAAGNAIAVCSMEYIHPDSGAAVSPTMTLANPEYQMLRSEALNLAEKENVVGACMVVFRLDEASFDHDVLELSPGTASDFAGAAAGYPLRQVAAMLEAGARLDEISADEVGVLACYEPAPDSLAVRLPSPDGEAAGVGNNFPDAFRKALAAGGNPGEQILRTMNGFRQGSSLDEMQHITGLNRWFLAELQKTACAD